MTISHQTRPTVVCTVLSMALLVVACGQQPEGDVIATFNNGVITRPEFDSYLLALDKRTVRTDASVSAENAMKELLREYATTRILAAEASASAPDAAPLLYVTPEARFLVQYYRQRAGKRSYEVTDEEALASYQERMESHYTLPERVRFKHVFLRKDVHNPTELAALERSVVNEYRTGAQFEELVEKYSDSASKQNGGMVGPVYRGRLDEDFEEQLFTHPAGDDLVVIRTDLGTHLLVIEEMTQPRVLPFEEVKKRVVSGLIEKKNEAEREKLFNELKTRYGVVDRTDETGLTNEEIVLTISERSATRKALDEYLARSAPYGAIHQSANPKVRRTMVDTLIEFNLMYLDAVEKGFDEEPNFQERWRLNKETMLASQAMKKHLREWADKIDDETILEFFNEHQNRFAQPRLLDISYLFLPFGGLSPFEMQLRLEEIREIAISRGFDSQELATKCAEEKAICVNAGSISTRDVGRIGPKVQRAALEIEPPGVSDPVKGENGLYVIAVHGSEERRALAPPEDMAAIRARYLQLEESSIIRAVRESLLEESSFNIVAPLASENAVAPEE